MNHRILYITKYSYDELYNLERGSERGSLSPEVFRPENCSPEIRPLKGCRMKRITGNDFVIGWAVVTIELSMLAYVGDCKCRTKKKYYINL